MSLFRRKKKDEDEIPGIVQLYFEQDMEPIEKNRGVAEEHLRNLHMPELIEEEKRKHDFVDLGMPRAYMDALDDIEFTLHELLASGDQVVGRWTVTGIQRRELLGLEPSNEAVTIDGITICVVKYERVRQEWTYWELPALTERLVGAAPAG
jgi:predicted ester cyclase